MHFSREEGSPTASPLDKKWNAKIEYFATLNRNAYILSINFDFLFSEIINANFFIVLTYEIDDCSLKIPYACGDEKKYRGKILRRKYKI